jgi:hypothetical protein
MRAHAADDAAPVARVTPGAFVVDVPAGDAETVYLDRALFTPLTLAKGRQVLPGDWVTVRAGDLVGRARVTFVNHSIKRVGMYVDREGMRPVRQEQT